MSKIYQGTVTFFNDEKGFGFIKADCASSYFVHISEYIDKGKGCLIKGARVEFAVGPGKNDKLMAIDVRIIG